MAKKTLIDIIKEDADIERYKNIIREAGEIPPPFSMFTEGLGEYREKLKKLAEEYSNNK